MEQDNITFREVRLVNIDARCLGVSTAQVFATLLDAYLTIMLIVLVIAFDLLAHYQQVSTLAQSYRHLILCRNSLFVMIIYKDC